MKWAGADLGANTLVFEWCTAAPGHDGQNQPGKLP